MYGTLRKLARQYQKPAIFSEAGAEHGRAQADIYDELLSYADWSYDSWFKGFWWYDTRTVATHYKKIDYDEHLISQQQIGSKNPNSHDAYTPTVNARFVLSAWQKRS
jgi:hypothetical protein